MIKVKVQKISYHPPSRSYAVILREIGGDRSMPVIVGSFEAQSIALAIEVVETPRPLTHDLICDLISDINGELNTIEIHNLSDGVFYARMDLYVKEIGQKVVDARPSDAIAVALRMNTPILVSEDVMLKASILDETKDENKKIEKKINLSINVLKEKLKAAVEREEYEVAAKIRDRISKMES